MMNWKSNPQPQLDDEQRISRVTRSIAADQTLTNYAPKRAQSEPQAYSDVLEQVRALSIKAVDTYGNKVIDDVQHIVQEHLEVALKLADRAQEISDHYHSEMSALRKDTNDFTNHARRDLERLEALGTTAPAATGTVIGEEKQP